MASNQNAPELAEKGRRKATQNVWDGNKEAKEATERLVKESLGCAGIIRELETRFGLKISRYQIEDLKSSLRTESESPLATEKPPSLETYPEEIAEMATEMNHSGTVGIPGWVKPFEPLPGWGSEGEATENLQNLPQELKVIQNEDIISVAEPAQVAQAPKEHLPVRILRPNYTSCHCDLPDERPIGLNEWSIGKGKAIMPIRGKNVHNLKTHAEAASELADLIGRAGQTSVESI